MGKGVIAISQGFGDDLGPVWYSLGGVNDEPLGTSADDICICALESELDSKATSARQLPVSTGGNTLAWTT